MYNKYASKIVFWDTITFLFRIYIHYQSSLVQDTSLIQ